MIKKTLLLFLAALAPSFGANVLIRDLSTTIGLPASNTYIMVDGATQGTAKMLLATLPQVTATRATLAGLSVTGISTGVAVQTLGGSSVGDGLGSLYYYNSSSTATPNGTTIIQPTVGSGRWLIVLNNALTPPGPSTLGGVFSKAGVTHQYLSALDTAGNFTLAAVSTADVSGLGTMAGQNASAVAITGGTIAGAAVSASTVTSTGSITSRNLNARFAEVINALDYGCDNTGTIDNFNAITAVYNAALANDGTVPELLLSRYIAGFTTPPSNTWSGRPSLTLTGALSGASGFQAYGNINPQGYMVSVEVANRGTGYNILTYVCNRTNGNPTITLSSGTFDARIVAGTAVRFDSTSTSCAVLTRNSNTSLTLTENMTFTNADQFVFGMPVPNINGTPAPNDIIPVVGTKRKVKFPAGSYLLTGSWPNMGGLSNVDFDATGANFVYTNVTGGSVGIRNSTAINWDGGEFMYEGSRFSQPTTRSRYPGQEGFAIGGSQFVTVRNVTTWSAFEFGFVAGGDGTINTSYWGQWIKFDSCRAITPLGDGFHVTTGNQWVRITNCEVIMPGDDAFAVVNDWNNSARNPTDIEYSNCRVSGGLYRGCVALGSSYVRFINITGRDTHGPFLWALVDNTFAAPSYVTFENIVAENLGNTAVTTLDSNSGIGIRAQNMTGLRIRNVSFKQDATAFGNSNPWQVQDSTIADADWPGRKIETVSSNGTLAGTLDTDLPCLPGNGFASVLLTGPHRYKLTGTITARSSTGSFGQIWPVFYDPGTGTEYGGGSSIQWTDTGERNILTCDANIEIQSASKTICFKLKQGGGGVTLDAGTTSGPNSVIIATQID